MVDRRTPVGGRRAARASGRRPSVLTLLTVLIPLATIAALALVRPQAEPPRVFEPTTAQMLRSTSVCPPALPGTGQVSVANADRAEGEVLLRGEASDRTLDVTGRPTQLNDPRAVSLHASGELAPGLTATRSGSGRAVTCDQPRPEQWFTGVGAGAEHSSRLTLVNPDRGPAVADVVVLGARGVVDVPALRGVRVLGGRTETFDLARIAPTRDALALQVSVTRGRLGVSVVDVHEALGRGPRLQDWLPAQIAPGETSYIPASGPRADTRTLAVANPGDSQVRVTVKLVSDESEFTPTDFDEIQVAPQSVAEVDVTRLLRSRTSGDVVGLRLEATSPVTASLASRLEKDLSLAAGIARVEDRAAIALPRGAKRLLVMGATARGVVTWTAFDVDGSEIGGERVEIDPATSSGLALPRAARLVELRLESADAFAAVLLGPPGVANLGLSELVATTEVPHVRQAP